MKQLLVMRSMAASGVLFVLFSPLLAPCGIVGYVGRSPAQSVVLEGLSRLEYRGYDSAGFACLGMPRGELQVVRAEGKLCALEEKLARVECDGPVGIGHTRWATHGPAIEANAHPHVGCHGKIALVHNGIIENSRELRKTLEDEGHLFTSSTDTEVVVHLLESYLSKHNKVQDALRELVAQLKGSYALVMIAQAHPGKLFLARKRSPLLIGIGDAEMFVGSDQMVFADRTDEALILPDESFAILDANTISLYDFSGKSLSWEATYVENTYEGSDKQGYEHYMLKEINEQNMAIKRTVSHCKDLPAGLFTDERLLCPKAIRWFERIELIAAGSSWHASKIAQLHFEEISRMPTSVHLASEFNYRTFFPNANTLYIFVSQSGETADTLESLRQVSEYNLATLALTNVENSSLATRADGVLHMKAGVERSVCSTKAFSCMVGSLYWLALYFARVRGEICEDEYKHLEDNLFVAADVLDASLQKYRDVVDKHLAPAYKDCENWVFLGRHVGYPFALEAALKLKELSYRFALSYPAGELKHGPLALIEEEVPVVIFSSLDDVIYQKIVSNAQEVRARGGKLLSFVFEGQKELIELSDDAIVFPRVSHYLESLAMTGVMQYFVYRITCLLGLPIDQPRNLAKSVTVE